MTTAVKNPISPAARIILDWLCKQTPRVFDFTEVADGVGIERNTAEHAIIELRHQRAGAPLKGVTAEGRPLRSRYAYLPADAPARQGWPPVPEHKAGDYVHPSVQAFMVEKAEAEVAAAAAEIPLREEQAMRARAMRQQKLDRKLALTRERARWAGIEKDELQTGVPSLEEVLAAGYPYPAACGIVAEQEALADGKTPQEAEVIGAMALDAATAQMPPDAPWTGDADVERALGHHEPPTLSGDHTEAPTVTIESGRYASLQIADRNDASPLPSDADNFEPSVNYDDAEPSPSAPIVEVRHHDVDSLLVTNKKVRASDTKNDKSVKRQK